MDNTIEVPAAISWFLRLIGSEARAQIIQADVSTWCPYNRAKPGPQGTVQHCLVGHAQNCVPGPENLSPIVLRKLHVDLEVIMAAAVAFDVLVDTIELPAAVLAVQQEARAIQEEM